MCRGAVLLSHDCHGKDLFDCQGNVKRFWQVISKGINYSTVRGLSDDSLVQTCNPIIYSVIKFYTRNWYNIPSKPKNA